MSDNISTYNFNEADFHLGRVEVVYNLTSNKHGGIDINNLASRLGVGRATALRTLECTTQLGFRQSNFSLGVSCLRSRYDRLHYKRLHDRFYSEITYVRPTFQSLHKDSCVQFFFTKYHFTWDNPMDGDTRENVGNALLSFTQQVGVPDELITNHDRFYST